MSINLNRYSRSTGRGAYEELHFRDLFIHLFHELYYEVDKLMLEHFLGVKIGDKEGYIIPLRQSIGLHQGSRAARVP